MTNHVHHHSIRAAFSLVELLAALTLSAMIMAVLLGLVAKMSLARDVLKQQKPFEPWKTILKQQLQNDYVGCRAILISPKQIRMDGYAEFQSADGVRRNQPCTINYFVVSDERGNWLYREQKSLLESANSNRHRELVCHSIVGFRSLSNLSTDVAPGVLQIELLEVVEDTNVDEKSALKTTTQERIIPIALTRHGLPQ